MDTLQQLRSGALQGARRLTLREGLTALPDEVYALADTLEVLDLSGNALQDLPHDLARLHRLRVIFCGSNRFTRLPEVLGDCPALEMVGFKANQIQHVPAAALPTPLRWLILTDNRISTLPEALGERPALQKMALAGNRLTALPQSLAGLQRLELLRISANQLTGLPDDLLALPRLTWLAHGGNPFSTVHESAAVAQLPTPQVPWAELTLQALLGEGASGYIHRAARASGEPVALKVFKGEVTSDGWPATELAACLQAGSHPGLIPALGRLEGHPAGADGLLMPLIPPEFRPLAGPPSLASCTRDVYDSALRLTAPAAHTLAASMAGALAHLHAQGLTHGDFYAHNILHDGQGQGRLGDFGAASFLAAVPARQAERLKAHDVRALGCLLEELLACCDADGAAVLGLQALTQACLAPDADARPTAADAAQVLAGLTAG